MTTPTVQPTRKSLTSRLGSPIVSSLKKGATSCSGNAKIGSGTTSVYPIKCWEIMSPDIEGFTLAEPIVAYRTWYIKPMIVPLFQEEDDCEDYGEYPLALYPMSNKTAWQKGVNEAECKTTTSAKNIYHESHQSPHPQCLCGLHANFAYKNKDQITGWSIFAGSMIIDGAVLIDRK